MTSLTDLLQHGAAYGWLFIPTAILLGALHGLEPGHSKSLMAAFIVTVHGTVKQAVLLGISATVSHTAIVWVVALVGLYLGRNHDMAVSEPYFQLASAVLIVGIAIWMLLRIHHARHHHAHQHAHQHAHGHEHSHDHEDEIKRQFAGKMVTDGQIIMFGLTGGLLPCPAAITVLLLCLQIKEIALGMVLVLCFSIGLAATLVASGVVAALGIRAASRRFQWIPAFIHRAPYIAGCITLAVGSYIGVQALIHIGW